MSAKGASNVSRLQSRKAAVSCWREQRDLALLSGCRARGRPGTSGDLCLLCLPSWIPEEREVFLLANKYSGL